LKDGRLENLPEENTKLQKIIKDFYNQNKDIINKYLQIDNINNLNPEQATKLVSLISISKIKYNNSLSILP
jgi:hypothetical protein